MDPMISLGQKNTLAEYMILSGADNRPPMLDKDLYDSWKSRMELYMQNREHRRMILESVEHGPLIWPTVEDNGVIRTKKYAELSAAEKIQADCDMKATNIILQGLPADIYSLVNHHRVAKDLWERVQLLMQGTSLTKQERECKLYDAFGKFTHIKGESLHMYYLRFTQLINDMNIYKMKMEQFQVNIKFLSSLPPEWSKFVTDDKLVKICILPTLISFMHILNNTKSMQMKSSPHYGSIPPIKYYSTTYPSIPPAITYPSALYPHAYSSTIHQEACPQPQSVPQIEYTISTVNQQTNLAEFPQIDSGLACPKPKRKRDAMWFREKVLLVEAQGNGKVLTKEELEFLADPGIAEAVQDTNSSAQQDALILPVFEQLFNSINQVTNYSKDFGKCFVLQRELSDEQALHPIIDQSSSSSIKIKAPRELRKVTKVQIVFNQMEVAVQQYHVDKESELQAKDMTIKKFKAHIKRVNETSTGESVKKDLDEIETINIELEHRVTKLIAENEHLKQTYKQLYDPINHYEFVLRNKLNLWLIKKLKGKDIVDNAAQMSNAATIALGMYTLDPIYLAPKVKNNKEAHEYYLKHTMEQAAIFREVVEQAKSRNPLDSAFYSACNIPKVTNRPLLSSTRVKPSTSASGSKPLGAQALCSVCNECLFDANHAMCLIDHVNSMNVHDKSASKKNKKRKEWKPTGKVFNSVRYKWKPTMKTNQITYEMRGKEIVLVRERHEVLESWTRHGIEAVTVRKTASMSYNLTACDRVEVQKNLLDRVSQLY
ncbi:hypothetical protein Tco_0703078 [Tanacetum coccineum]|uniref:Integrase, catalytic region, zinc finger, CCHC-type, peptidase aspartic, catalytic n=1 Tax=Tanacetum coccineum TaxID=301880 RepID=A0ABQ4XZ54_9ASTR